MQQLLSNLKRFWSVPARLAAGVFVLLVTLGAGGCPAGCEGSASGTLPSVGGIFYSTEIPRTGHLWARGETKRLDIRIVRLTGEKVGDRVRVKLSATNNCVTFTPNNFEVTLTENPLQVESVATMVSNIDVVEVNVERTAGPNATPSVDLLSDTIAGAILATLVRGEITPNPGQVASTGQSTFTARIWPRGDMQGPANIYLTTGHSSLTVSPDRFVINVPAGATSPVERTFTLRGNGSPAGESSIDLHQDLRFLNRTVVTVIDGANPPTFKLALSRTSATGATYEQVLVRMTVSSEHNFSGKVFLSWSAPTGIGVSPTTQPIEVYVSPGSPKHIDYRVTRYHHEGAAVVNFRGTGEGITSDKIVPFTLNEP